MAELLSRKMGGGSTSSCVRSTRSLLNHTVWYVVEVVVTYSSFADYKDTMGFFVDAHETRFVPN